MSNTIQELMGNPLIQERIKEHAEEQRRSAPLFKPSSLYKELKERLENDSDLLKEIIEPMESDNKPQEGKRLNKGKLRWQNVPMWMLEPIIEVGQVGEQKYGAYNFLSGLKVNECLDSLKRHISAFENPNKEDLDEETKLHHMAHAAWNALICYHMVTTRPDLDDRYKGNK